MKLMMFLYAFATVSFTSVLIAAINTEFAAAVIISWWLCGIVCAIYGYYLKKTEKKSNLRRGDNGSNIRSSDTAQDE